MRIVRRRLSTSTPRALWHRLAEPRRWAQLLAAPERPALRRVKLVDASEPARGALVHVLYADKTWETMRVTDWRPERCLAFATERGGAGDDAGGPVRPPRRERLILIPQGRGAEAEWTVDLGGLAGVIGRWAGAEPAWGAALEERLEHLCGTAGGAASERAGLADRANP